MVKKTAHFIIYYQQNSLVEKELSFVIKSLEKSYTDVIHKLHLRDDSSKIKYYFYPNNKLKLEAMGDDGNANAVVKDFAIHGIYNQKIKIIGRHEIVHLLVSDWGRPPELLRQGLAEAMEKKWHGIDHHQWVKKFCEKKNLISLDELISDKKFWQYSDLVTYPESGSYAKFLIEKYGLDDFKKLYQKLNYNFSDQKNKKIFTTIIGKSIKETESNWIKFSTC